MAFTTGLSAGLVVVVAAVVVVVAVVVVGVVSVVGLVGAVTITVSVPPKLQPAVSRVTVARLAPAATIRGSSSGVHYMEGRFIPDGNPCGQPVPFPVYPPRSPGGRAGARDEIPNQEPL